MLDLVRPKPALPKCDGTSRREFLQIGTLGMLGLTLPTCCALRAWQRIHRAVRKRSVILLFLDGGASQLETFDPKMDVPGRIPQPLRLDQDGAARRRVRRPVAEDGGAGRPHVDRPHVHARGRRPRRRDALGEDRLPLAAGVSRQGADHPAADARRSARSCRGIFGATHPETGVPTYVRVLSNHGGYPGDDAVWLGRATRRCAAAANARNPMLEQHDASRRAGPPGRPPRLARSRSTSSTARVDQSGTMDGMDSSAAGGRRGARPRERSVRPVQGRRRRLARSTARAWARSCCWRGGCARRAPASSRSTTATGTITAASSRASSSSVRRWTRPSPRMSTTSTSAA